MLVSCRTGSSRDDDRVTGASQTPERVPDHFNRPTLPDKPRIDERHVISGLGILGICLDPDNLVIMIVLVFNQGLKSPEL